MKELGNITKKQVEKVLSRKFASQTEMTTRVYRGLRVHDIMYGCVVLYVRWWVVGGVVGVTLKYGYTKRMKKRAI